MKRLAQPLTEEYRSIQVASRDLYGNLNIKKTVSEQGSHYTLRCSRVERGHITHAVTAQLGTIYYSSPTCKVGYTTIAQHRRRDSADFRTYSWDCINIIYVASISWPECKGSIRADDAMRPAIT